MYTLVEIVFSLCFTSRKRDFSGLHIFVNCERMALYFLKCLEKMIKNKILHTIEQPDLKYNN